MIIGQEKPSLEEVLEHHGIKGMHWGVRRSTGSGGSARSQKKAAKQEAKAAKEAAKPKKLTRQEVQKEKADFYQKKADHILETAMKDPESLIALRTQFDAVIVTGDQFMHHMQAGGVMDIRGTDVYATRSGGKGPYVLNANPNARFVRSDRKH